MASAILSDHPDIWFMSAKFQANIGSLNEDIRKSAVAQASKFTTQVLNCNINSSQSHLLQGDNFKTARCFYRSASSKWRSQKNVY